MKVIFIKMLKNQGAIGDIKEVKDGYAMNFLIKNGYALAANTTNLAIHNKKQQQNALDENLLIKEKESEKLKIEKEKIIFTMKTGKEGRMFGTVTSKQIKEQLTELGYNIDKKQIQIDHAIDSLGFHKVNIELHKKVNAILNIQVIAK